MCEPTKPTIILEQTGTGYRIKSFDAMHRDCPTKVTSVDAVVVEDQIEILKKAKISLYPTTPPIFDGTLYDLKIFGEHADLRVTWWTEPPNNCKALGKFAEWLGNFE